MYHYLKRARLKMLIEVLENDLRTDRSEERFSPSTKITIEHIIPQAWTPLTWPLEVPDDPRATEHRLALIHVLGNLTLVNDKLNPTLSNGPWESKRPELAKHSVLRLNHEILDDARPWTDSRVVERGIELAKRVVRLWPGPEPESIDYDALNPLAQAEAAGGVAAEPIAAERLSTMQQLLDAGLLEPDDLLLWRRPELDEVHEAHVRAGGVIETEDGELYDSPAAAASHLAEGSVNGWQAWRVVRLGDRRLSEVRDELD